MSIRKTPTSVLISIGCLFPQNDTVKLYALLVLGAREGLRKNSDTAIIPRYAYAYSKKKWGIEVLGGNKNNDIAICSAGLRQKYIYVLDVNFMHSSFRNFYRRAISRKYALRCEASTDLFFSKIEHALSKNRRNDNKMAKNIRVITYFER
ncbi:hypothetical protein [Magnetococcus marinus]|uniref:hypothetical protein n=1 Tax=Magnetococcus marinus TaxID=1124597 RepID=UPI0005A24562|nr:hypothetical protein [Magnetococcus marinus]